MATTESKWDPFDEIDRLANAFDETKRILDPRDSYHARDGSEASEFEDWRVLYALDAEEECEIELKYDLAMVEMLPRRVNGGIPGGRRQIIVLWLKLHGYEKQAEEFNSRVISALKRAEGERQRIIDLHARDKDWRDDFDVTRSLYCDMSETVNFLREFSFKLRNGLMDPASKSLFDTDIPPLTHTGATAEERWPDEVQTIIECLKFRKTRQTAPRIHGWFSEKGKEITKSALKNILGRLTSEGKLVSHKKTPQGYGFPEWEQQLKSD